MSSLHGVRWGALSEETKKSLLDDSLFIDGESCNEVNEEKCIVALTDTLSVSGRVLDGKVVIDDEAIICNPKEGIILEGKDNIKFEIYEVMTVSEASVIWNKSEGAIRAAIKNKKFVLGVDYRKAGRITLITRESMIGVYGEPKHDL